jgi:hypothetical protein
MKAYMVFSRFAGSEEGAALVFAHNSREAKKVGWNGIGSDLANNDFTDLAVRLIRNGDWLFAEGDQDKLNQDIPHIIESPKCCNNCQMWGESPLDKGGMCQGCRENYEFSLAHLPVVTDTPPTEGEKAK